jgi:TM2 domain-containing membrane protein YozV
MTLTTEQMMLIEQRVANEKKSMVVAYLLWWFFGILGGHNFYLGKTPLGFLQLAFFFFGFLMIGGSGGNSGALLMGGSLLLADVIIQVVGLFTIPGSIRKHREGLRQKYSLELAAANTTPRPF